MVIALLLALVMPHAELQIRADRAVEDTQIETYLMITHDEEEEVYPASATCNGGRVPLDFVQDSMQSSVTLIKGKRDEIRSITSTYRLHLPPAEAGTYDLLPIKVRVGNRYVETPLQSYTIHSIEESEKFRLEAYVQASCPLYPGQRAQLVYRMIWERPIETTVEELPLLEASGFKRIGQPTMHTDLQGAYTAEEFVQEVEALEPGIYTFGASFMEGRAYKRDFFGRRVYDPGHLRADAPPLQIEVTPFPTVGAPTNFDGALGSYTLSSKLLSPTHVAVGDRLRLQVDVVGSGEASTLHLPEMPLGPAFRMSDLPRRVEEIPGGKRYILEMRPLSDEIIEIPSLTFASFDPTTSAYKIATSEPIPLVVTNLPAATPNVRVDRPLVSASPDRLNAIAGCCELSCRDLKRGRTPWWVLWVFPFAAASWLVQWVIRERFVVKKTEKKGLSSSRLLKRAATQPDRSRAVQEIEAALLLAIYEAGLTDDLPLSAPPGPIADFIDDLHFEQYASGQQPPLHELVGIASQLREEL